MSSWDRPSSLLTLALQQIPGYRASGVPGSLVGVVNADGLLEDPMRARDLAAPYPTVDLSTPVVQAARLLAEQNLPGLIVVDGQRPVTILPGTQVLRLAVPGYCQDDPALARVIDEPSADLFLRNLGDRTVAEALPRERRELPVLDPDATVLQVAAVMAREHSPLVAIVENQGAMLGVITLDALLERVLA
jgi:CBS domain-containing protein